VNTPTETDQDDCIIARCNGCKRVVFIAVNRPRVMDKDMHRELADLLFCHRSDAEHMTVAEARKQQFGCKCNEEAAQ
jgi:hypothetical protein